MILTETDDIKLADFGLAQEYIALKQIGVQRDDGVQYYNNTLAGPQWMTAYAQYYMNTLAGTPYWMAPEVFLAIIQRKPTFLHLVLLFFFFFFFCHLPARLHNDEWENIIWSIQRCNSVGKVGLGYANTSTAFSSASQGRSLLMQSLALNSLGYNPHYRLSAQDIFDRLIWC